MFEIAFAILVIYTVYVLLADIFDFVSGLFSPGIAFFVENYYFVIAVGCFLYILYYLKKPKTYKSQIIYSNTQIMANKDPLPLVPESVGKDLSGVDRMVTDLIIAIDQPSPSTAVGNILRTWGHQLDAKRVHALREYMEAVAGFNLAITDAKRKMEVSKTLLKDLIDGDVAEAKRAVERAVSKHKAELESIKHQGRKDEAEIRDLNADALIKEAQANRITVLTSAEDFAIRIKAQTEADHKNARTNLINAIVEAGINLKGATFLEGVLYQAIIAGGEQFDVKDYLEHKFSAQLEEELKLKNKLLEHEVTLSGHKTRTATGGTTEPERGFAPPED